MKAHHMVGIAQLVERLVVVQDVAGSSPVTHPNKKPEVISLGFLYLRITDSLFRELVHERVQHQLGPSWLA